MAGLAASRRRQVLTGVACETDKPEWHFFDEERRAQQDYLDAELPGRLNRLRLALARRDALGRAIRRRPHAGRYHLLTWEEHGARRS